MIKALAPFNFPSKLTVSPRDGFSEALIELGATNPNVVVLTADLAESTRANQFAQMYPERFIDVGVAEQNLAGVAAGLSHEGKIPIITSYAVFSPGRNWDQIRVSICYSQANVKIIGSHAGLNVGPDGATHQALEDLAITRVLPNLTVVSPADAEEARKATLALADHKGPCYLRFGRASTPVFTTKETPFKLGQAVRLTEGNDVTLIATGDMVYRALEAADRLSGEIKLGVINIHTIKPLDEETLVRAARISGAVVTAEEHQISGGLGGAVAEVLAENYPVPIRRLGVRDTFGESGRPDQLIDHYHLGTDHLIEAIRSAWKQKHAG